MGRQLKNVTFFVTGDVESGEPKRAFFTYGVKTSKGSKDNCVFAIDELDADKTLAEIWIESVKEIKELEGVTE